MGCRNQFLQTGTPVLCFAQGGFEDQLAQFQDCAGYTKASDPCVRWTQELQLRVGSGKLMNLRLAWGQCPYQLFMVLHFHGGLFSDNSSQSLCSYLQQNPKCCLIGESGNKDCLLRHDSSHCYLTEARQCWRERQMLPDLCTLPGTSYLIHRSLQLSL